MANGPKWTKDEMSHRIDARIYIKTFQVRAINPREPERYSVMLHNLALKLLELAELADKMGD